MSSEHEDEGEGENSHDSIFDSGGNELLASIQTQCRAEGPPPAKRPREALLFPPGGGLIQHPSASARAAAANIYVGSRKVDSPPDPAFDSFDSVGDDLLSSIMYDDVPEPEKSWKRPSPKEISRNNNNVPVQPHPPCETSVPGPISKKTETTKAVKDDDAKQSSSKIDTKKEPDSTLSMFDDDDDALLLEVAAAVDETEDFLRDIEEEGWVEDDGVEEENRFRTRIGRPHPMLMPEILSIVFENVRCPKTLKSSRLVCQVWNEVATPVAFQYVTFKNASHVIQPYPYGLGYAFLSHSFTCPNPVPVITRIRVADPCITFSKGEFADFFRFFGRDIKYFGFDANFWCDEHTSFLRNVLLRWCTKTLEEVELFGVTNIDFVEANSGMHFAGALLNIKRFRIIGGNWNTTEHHHYSSVQTVDLATGWDYVGYGGIVFDILRSCKSLQSLVLELGFRSSAFCLQRYAMFNFLRDIEDQGGKEVKTLKLTGGLLSRSDFNRMQHCRFPLKKLVLGMLASRLNRTDFENLLISVSTTLEELEIGGVQDIDVQNRGRLRVFRFRVSWLERLKVLVLGDGCRLRVEDVPLLRDSLQELVVKCVPVTARYCTIVRRFLNRFVRNIEREIPLKRLVFESCPGIWLEHGKIVRGMRNQGRVGSLSVDCFIDGVAACMQAYSTVTGLDDFSVKILKGQWVGRSWTDFPRGVTAWAGLRLLKVLNISQVWLVLGIGQVRELLGDTLGFYSLELSGFMIYDDEAEEIVQHLVEHVNFTRFTDCIIAKKGYEELRPSLLFEGSGKKQFVRFSGIELSRVNIGMNRRELFHRL